LKIEEEFKMEYSIRGPLACPASLMARAPEGVVRI